MWAAKAVECRSMIVSVAGEAEAGRLAKEVTRFPFMLKEEAKTVTWSAVGREEKNSQAVAVRCIAGSWISDLSEIAGRRTRVGSLAYIGGGGGTWHCFFFFLWVTVHSLIPILTTDPSPPTIILI